MGLLLPFLAQVDARPLPYLPAEVVSYIIGYYRREDRMGDLTMELKPWYHLAAQLKGSRGSDPDFIAFKSAQAELSAFMSISKTWYYAAKPHVYRHPFITSSVALDIFAQTVSRYPDLACTVRSIQCISFSTMYGQPARRSFPQIQARANMRLEHGSYASLLLFLKACERVDTIGLRFIDLSSVLTLAHFFNQPPTATSLRSLSLCGSCFESRSRHRLELGRVMTSHLNLPNLEELWLENFFLSPRYVFSWPKFPKLRKFSLLRTWVTKNDCHFIPPDLSDLRDLTIGVSSISSKRVLQYIGHYAGQLERLHLVGSSIWRDAKVTLAPMVKLRELVLESTFCGFTPPLIVDLPPRLETLSIERFANSKAADVAWTDMVHRALHANKPPALKAIRIVGLSLDDDQFKLCTERNCFVGLENATGRVLNVDHSCASLPPVQRHVSSH